MSQTCKILGISRNAFYHYQKLVTEGGIQALFNKSRRVSNFKKRTDEITEQAVADFAIKFPALEQQRASNKLRKKGIFIFACDVHSVWLFQFYIQTNIANFLTY